jgi:hypothetical protein
MMEIRNLSDRHLSGEELHALTEASELIERGFGRRVFSVRLMPEREDEYGRVGKITRRVFELVLTFDRYDDSTEVQK